MGDLRINCKLFSIFYASAVIRAMLAAIFAAEASLEVVFLRKYHQTTLVKVIIPLL